MEKYDRIGKDYNSTRLADLYIAAVLRGSLKLESGLTCIDIGCGTGNYTNAVFNQSTKVLGVDPSSQMISKARASFPHINFKVASANNIDENSNSFEAALAVLTVHHWPDLLSGFKEIYRILKPGSKFVLFTSTKKQMENYWLNSYFPQMMERAIKQMPSLEEQTDALEQAGFSTISHQFYEVYDEQKDMFLYAGKARPELYLDSRIRQGISSFADLAFQEEVDEGLEMLEDDINSGKMKYVLEACDYSLGDYMVFTATK